MRENGHVSPCCMACVTEGIWYRCCSQRGSWQEGTSTTTLLWTVACHTRCDSCSNLSSPSHASMTVICADHTKDEKLSLWGVAGSLTDNEVMFIPKSGPSSVPNLRPYVSLDNAAQGAKAQS